MTESHPLPPFLPPGATVLMLGSFPPPKEKWAMEFYYPILQYDMWRIFGLVFFEDAGHFLGESKKQFAEERIRMFLIQKGIALCDTAAQVIRRRQNASDKFLEVVKAADIACLLDALPFCRTLVTTGEKATDTLCSLLSVPQAPRVGGSVALTCLQRPFQWFRMPSSSRAYPLSLHKKAEAYKRMFQAVWGDGR